MNYYLVDYENVKTRGLDGIGKLREEDVVCIFYSENADSLTFGLHRRLNESKAQLLFQRVEVGGKNALDFQLSSYLGYIIYENKGKDIAYYVVTKDQGFSCLVQYWKRRKVNVSLVTDVSEQSEEKAKNAKTNNVKKVPKVPKAPKAPKVPKEPKEKKDDKMQKELVKHLKTLEKDKNAVQSVAKIIEQYNTKLEIHNALMKTFPSKDHELSSKIYNEIKPLIVDKKVKKA